MPDRPDHRDLKMAHAPAVLTAALPARVDLRPWGPVIYDQLDVGSCTANGIARAMQLAQIKQKRKVFRPSRLFIYYNERVMEGTVESDGGAEIRDGIKSVNRLGVCPETTWPYDPARFAVRPPAEAYREAKLEQAVRYQRVPQRASQIRAVIAGKTPVVFGFTVYESFESDQVAETGVVRMPGHRESARGGHCMVAVGYDDASRRFICANSWGEGWGDKGYCTLPYEYLTDQDLADDFWAITQVE